ncbi:MAG: penicillin acylase family protein [Dehalococcoidia bacterium]
MRRVFTVTISVLVLIALVAVPACAPDNGVTPVIPEIPEYNLTVVASPVEGGTATDATGASPYEGATAVDIEATPKLGWEFVNWTATAGIIVDENAPATQFIMPNADATVTANFAMLRATIIRDSFGVPHVFAETKEDLAFGAGYAMAQDRLWQADVMRRLPSGRLAELGLATIEQDAEMRGLWYGQQELLEIYDEWDPGIGYGHLKDMVEAYVEGINSYIDDALAAFYGGDWSLLPIEYVANGLVSHLEPFTVADVVAVTVLMAWRFGGTGGNEGDIYEALLTLQAMHGGAPGGAIWSDVFPLNDAGAPVTIPDAVFGGEPLLAPAGDVSGDIDGLIDQYRESRAAQDELFQSMGVPGKFGSNAVPVSGDLSATGNTLQLGGPQMGYSVPQIVYEIGLHGDGINAVGMAFPAAGPFILIGVSEYGAWTSTTGASDVMDIRVLGLNPEPTNPAVPEYWFDGQWVEMEVRTETFYGPKKMTSEERTFYRSHYGPIVGIDGLQAFTLHTPFYGSEIGGEQGWQLFQEATSIEEFEEAVELIWPSHNFIWSGVDGNIGYFHAGRFPVKPETADPRLPLMGDGTQEWVRVTEPEEMPRSINPDQGWLANWNNKPIAGWPFAESDFHWGEGHRVQVLMGAMAMMAPGENLTTAHLNQINQIGGYHHTAGMSLAGDLIAAAMGSGDPILVQAGGHLLDWATAEPLPVSYVDFESPSWPSDPNPTYDHPGLTIFDAWFDRIVPKVFENILPPDLIGRMKGTFGNPGNLSLLIRVLREDESLLYPGYPTGAALNAMIVEALEEAVEYLESEYGEDMSTWLTPVRMQSYDAQGALPAVNPETGQGWHPRMNRGTYNHIAELSAPLPQGKSVIPPGQSGHMWLEIVGSNVPVPRPDEHAFDQVALYASWNYKPMHLSLAAVEAVETWRREFSR